MSTTAACLLTPLGVVVYTLHGGLKATFISDYLHTALIFAIIITFGFTVYATSPLIGSSDAMFDMLKLAAAAHPVDGNEVRLRVQNCVLQSSFHSYAPSIILPAAN